MVAPTCFGITKCTVKEAKSPVKISYIYTLNFWLGAPYIYDISRLRVKVLRPTNTVGTVLGTVCVAVCLLKYCTHLFCFCLPCVVTPLWPYDLLQYVFISVNSPLYWKGRSSTLRSIWLYKSWEDVAMSKRAVLCGNCEAKFVCTSLV
jgi:hypothetical protein